MGGIFRTLVRVLVGLILACVAAAVVQVLFVETPRGIVSAGGGEIVTRTTSVALMSLKTATHFAMFSAAFAFIAAGIAEWLSLRTPGYWLAVGTGIALLGFTAQYASEVPGQPSIFNNYALQAYLTAGFFGGFVYWLTAGAYSGAAHQHAAAETAQSAPQPRIIVEKTEKGERGAPSKGSLAERLARKRRQEEPDPATHAAPAGGPASPVASVSPAKAAPDKPAGDKGAPASAGSAKGSAEKPAAVGPSPAGGKPPAAPMTPNPGPTTSVPVTKASAAPAGSKGGEKVASPTQGADET